MTFMELAARWPVAGEFVALSCLGELSATIRRWFTSETLGKEEIAYLTELVRGAALVGPLVLGAKDRADFDDQMDRVVRLPRFYEAIERVFFGEGLSSYTETPSGFDTGRSAADQAALFVDTLGRGALRPLLRGFQYLLAIQHALEPLRRLEPRPEHPDVQSFRRRFFRKSQEQPLWFLTDPTMSVEVARAWLNLMDVLACMLAMARVFLASERPPEPWLSLAIVERWESDLYGLLRLVASVPGFDVPDDLVPVRDRYDLQRMEDNAERARLWADRLFAQADQRAEPIWPPLDEAEDG